MNDAKVVFLACLGGLLAAGATYGALDFALTYTDLKTTSASLTAEGLAYTVASLTSIGLFKWQRHLREKHLREHRDDSIDVMVKTVPAEEIGLLNENGSPLALSDDVKLTFG